MEKQNEMVVTNLATNLNMQWKKNAAKGKENLYSKQIFLQIIKELIINPQFRKEVIKF